MDRVDNSKLKQMMVIDPAEESEEEQKLFFDEFKNATLLVAFNEDGLPASLKVEGEDRFVVPLFTDEEELEKVIPFKDFHHGWIKARLIGELVFQLEDVDEIAINPLSSNAIGMSYFTFISIFHNDKIDEIEEIIKLYGKNLPEESRFYLREKEPLMKKAAVDGIFTTDLPFLADFKDDFNSEKKYVNILLIPKGIRFIPVGGDDRVADTIFAPTIKFKLIEENGDIFTWQCISQELKYSKNSNKIIYLIIVIIIIVLIIAIIKVIL